MVNLEFLEMETPIYFHFRNKSESVMRKKNESPSCHKIKSTHVEVDQSTYFQFYNSGILRTDKHIIVYFSLFISRQINHFIVEYLLKDINIHMV